MKKPALFSIALLAAAMPLRAVAIDTDRADVQAFIEDMVSKHNYNRAQLIEVLDDAASQPGILESISKPAEKTLTWKDYRKIFLTKARIEAGTTFWREHRDTLSRISDETGVAPEILVAIIGVETYFGRITGNHRVLDALATLAFDYPPRSSFFRRELEQFLLLVREEDMNPADATGSYAGAMGAPQFMPSSYRAYAVDASDDGKRDIWNNWQDVIGSVANYFVAHGWQPGREVATLATLADGWNGPPPKNTLKPEDTVGSLSEQGVLFATDLGAAEKSQLMKLDSDDGDEYWVGFHNFFVITRYNRSVMYALAVYQLGREIERQMESSDA